VRRLQDKGSWVQAPEVIKGRNAKGTTPVEHLPLHRRSIIYMADGQVKTKTVDLTTSTGELIVAALRDEQAVRFGFRSQAPAIGRNELEP
jgi:hypothetical protein